MATAKKYTYGLGRRKTATATARLYKGKGEILDHKISPVNREIILVKPFVDKGLSTADVYGKFDNMGLAADLNKPFPSDPHECDDDCCHEHDDEEGHLNTQEGVSEKMGADIQQNKHIQGHELRLQGRCGRHP